MSLLDDLQNIDLSDILDARAGISASVSTDGVQVVIDGGAVTSALGPLGEQLTAVVDALDDPAALMAPLLALFTELLDRVGATDLPIADLARAVTEGVEILAGVLNGIADDPLSAGGALGQALPQALETLGRNAGGYELAGGEGIGAFGALITRADAGLGDPAAIAELALDVLSPFPRDALDGLRAAVAAVLAATGGIALPATRTRGLADRFDAVTLAAEAGDAAGVLRAVAELDRARAQAVDVIRADLATVTAAIDRLPVDAVAGAVASAGNALAGAEKGVLELFAEWSADVASVRAMIEGLDPATALAQLDPLVDRLEAFLREHFEAPITALADVVGDEVHALFAHVPIRPVRQTISDALHEAAQAIADADLDAPAEQIRAVLGSLRELIADVDLADRVRDALGEVTGTLTTALDGVIAAMESVAAAVNAVAGPAADVLGRAVAAVQAFQEAVTAVTATVGAIDLNAAVDEVMAKVREIREAVEGVLSEVPLPEPVRPLVTQLAEQLEALNLDGDLADIPILAPMLDVVGRLELSETLGTVVHEGLTALRDAVAGIVPAQMIADIEAEIQAAIDVVAGFDPASLLSGVTELLDGVAGRIEAIDLASIGAAAHGPFTELLAAWDRVRPSTLLAPVSAAYRSILSGIPVPTPEAAIGTVGARVDSAADQAGRAATAPLAQAVPGAEPAPAGNTPPAAPAPPTEADLADLRPGDVIRLFGYLPGKLRQALAELDAGPAGQALDTIDAFIGGLARDLRRLATELAEIERRLDTGLDALVAPLAPAHARAQIAVQANFSGGGLDLQIALGGVNRSGPAAFRADLSAHTAEARGRVAGAGTRHASIAARLHHIAAALEASHLARLSGGLDDLLAALDPEPLAVEVDELVYAVILKAPELFEAIGPALDAAVERARALFGALNPAALAQRVLRAAVDAVQEELAVLDPALLAAELDEIHQAVRTSLAAYDPALLAAELAGVQAEVVAALREIDPAVMLGDLGDLDGLLERAAQALPTGILTGFPEQLTALDEAFAAVDLDAILETVAGLAPEILEAFQHALDGVRNEIVALLESLRYATARIEASVEVST
ncbi:hypothetical protein AB0I28_02290 [Phytomonospora sp. NPDC050363]|uniref:hypothetical protein n=1 Tax=Phytomonospora sp. NPDC050363 TaxID=3155642 RepID=UPI0033FC1DC8